MTNRYAEVCERIHGAVVPVPVFFRQDLTLDHAGAERFVDWQLDNGTRNFCLTFTFSELDFLTPDELVELTRTIAGVVGDRAVFISCTSGGPLKVVVKTVQQMEAAGAHAVFVHLPEWCLQNAEGCGDLYANYIRAVARDTAVPLMATALRETGGGERPMLTTPILEALCDGGHFIGIKDDVYILGHRLELIRKLGGRLAIIGGGMLRQYIFCHHHPCQGEFAGITNPRRGARYFELLDQNNYVDAMKMQEEDERTGGFGIAGLNSRARNHVMFYGMGFAETYLTREPIVAATAEQADAIIADMRTKPQVFERVVR